MKIDDISILMSKNLIKLIKWQKWFPKPGKKKKKNLTKLFGVCPFLFGTNKVEYDKVPMWKVSLE